MKKALVLLLLLPILAWAQSPLDGTWKVDLNSAQFPKKPDVFFIQDGMYHCKTCVPPIDVKADGQWQKVAGHPYMDQIMIKVVDDKHIEQATQKNGKPMGSEKDSVSADGKTITVDWVDRSSPKEVTGKSTLVRVAAGPAGSHAISGSWRAEKVADITQDALVFTYKSTADGMEYSTPTGQSYSAKYNGGPVSIKGDQGNTMVSIKKIGPNTLQETNTRDGKVVGVATMNVAANKMTIEFEDKLHGTTSKFVAEKQ